jgi:hypothetical protein
MKERVRASYSLLEDGCDAVNEAIKKKSKRTGQEKKETVDV